MVERLAEEKDQELVFTVTEQAVGDPMVLHDVPVQFGQNKKYRDRTVNIIRKD
jgi:hypothetical protein